MFSIKSLSKSTVAGLALGILLAGYAVFAFQGPSQGPPAGNVAAPINTGSSDQTKTGGALNVFGLWVNQALGVSGGATLGGTLNLQNNKIINVGSPSLAGDVATKEFVDGQTSGLQKRVSGSCPGGQGIRAVGADGSVTCQTIPEGLRNTDVVAVGAVQPYSRSTACNQPSDGGRRCDAYFNFWYTAWEERRKYDPRNVLTTSYSQALMPCYEIPNGSDRSCGAQRTYPVFSSFSCSSGFTADTGHPIAQAWDYFCAHGVGSSDCTRAVCRLP